MPNTVLTNNYPSVYDSDSKSVLELSARMYGKVNEVIDSQNTLKTDTEESIKLQDQNIEHIKIEVIPIGITSIFFIIKFYFLVNNLQNSLSSNTPRESPVQIHH
jgi:hypothetical protein